MQRGEGGEGRKEGRNPSPPQINQRGGEGGEGRKKPFPSPPPLSSHHFSRGQNTQNPVPLTFVAPQPHGNAATQASMMVVLVKFCCITNIDSL